MKTASIPARLRRRVIQRAAGLCEYCHKPQVTFFQHEIDHVIARKHGGRTTLDNLALTCFECNRYKGSDIASIDPETATITPLFNPRQQGWHEHFRLVGARIVALTPEGRATVLLLHFNDKERVRERAALQSLVGQ
ncbi:MAG: HNH endonuclease signature motif containing protein [Chloroflexota bacterium]